MSEMFSYILSVRAILVKMGLVGKITPLQANKTKQSMYSSVKICIVNSSLLNLFV